MPSADKLTIENSTKSSPATKSAFNSSGSTRVGASFTAEAGSNRTRGNGRKSVEPAGSQKNLSLKACQQAVSKIASQKPVVGPPIRSGAPA
jgi:hypothetical protein